MKRARLILALVLTIVMAAALFAAPVSAASNYTAVGITTNPTFQKALVMDEDANVPNVSFAFSIAPGTPQAANSTSGTVAVLAGPTATVSGENYPKIADVSFSTSDTTQTPSSGTSVNGVEVASGKKAAFKTATIDFTGVTFTEPGIYRYIVNETSTGQQGISYDTQRVVTDANGGVAKQRVLDVYVIDTNGSLSVDSCVFHEVLGTIPVTGNAEGTNGGVSTSHAAVADKSLGFVNEYASYNLTISKDVSGNQASRDKFFAVDVTIDNAVAGTVYTVDISGAQANSGSNAATIAANAGKPNPTSLTVPANATSVSATFYLSHGQSIVIKGLAANTSYTVTENEEDYTSAIAVTGDQTNAAAGDIASLSSNTVYDQAITADTTVAFTNTRNGVVPTGVMLSVVPGVAILGLAAFGLVALKRKKDEE